MNRHRELAQMMRAAAAPPVEDIITEGLLGRWALNGDANDSSGNDTHGTLVGIPTPVWGAGPLPGMGSLYFDGSGYVTTTNNLLNGSEAVTFCAWVKREVEVQYAGVVCMRDSKVTSLSTDGADADSVILYTSSAPSTGRYTRVEGLTLGQWDFIAASASVSTARTLVNDIEQTLTNNTRAFPLAITAGADLGFDSALSARKLNGYLSDVRIYNRVLDLAECTLIFNNQG